MKLIEQNEAKKLRLQGLAITEIAKKLKVNKSSVSLWVRDIELTDSQKESLERKKENNRKGFVKFSHQQGKRRKEEAIERHKKYKRQGYERARIDDKLRLIACLYAAEGTKSGDFQFSNSNPQMLKVVWNWLVKEVGFKNISIRIAYHVANLVSDENIRNYWKTIFGADDNHFRKSTVVIINRASQRKRIGKLPYGTVCLRAAKSTKLFHQVMGAFDLVCELDF